MTQELILLRGLPGSGKTTWAKAYIQTYPNARRVSKDDIRAMIGGEYSGPNEDTVIAIRNAIVKVLLSEGWTVVVDDTNLNERHRVKFQNLCSFYEAEYKVMTFDTPLDECIARDALRPNPVGEARIREMNERWKGPQISMDDMRKALGW